MSTVTRVAGRRIDGTNGANYRIHIFSWLPANTPDPMGLGQMLFKSIFQAVSISINEIQDVTGARIGGAKLAGDFISLQKTREGRFPD
jgi:hypothetical protein